MSWTSPITDRTLEDILQRTEKAFFNVSDWLRIYGNSQIVSILVNALLGLGVPFTELEPPAITHFPTADEINDLIANIDRLRQAAALPESSGVVPLKTDWQPGSGAAAPDYEDVNDWERDLDLIRSLLVEAMEYAIFCGVAAAGQPRYWQNRFRRWPHYVKPVDRRRLPRAGVAAAGNGITRANRWRSLAAVTRRAPRLGAAVAGRSYGRQNAWRFYGI